MEKQNEYLLQLLDEIERLRKNSIDNIKKTDLYDKNDVYKIFRWYDSLIYMIKTFPPQKQVAIVCVEESKAGAIKSVGYKYGTSELVEIMIASIN